MVILAVLCGLAIIAVDQFTKFYIASNFVEDEVHEFINGIINLKYVNNDGAAWSMLEGKTEILLGLTAVVMVICIVILVKNKLKDKLLFWAMILVLSGGVGNMIDRIFRKGFVVDFLQFDFWQSFPVFNIADCAIVIGGALMILYLLLDIISDFYKKKTKQENNEEN